MTEIRRDLTIEQASEVVVEWLGVERGELERVLKNRAHNLDTSGNQWEVEKIDDQVVNVWRRKNEGEIEAPEIGYKIVAVTAKELDKTQPGMVMVEKTRLRIDLALHKDKELTAGSKAGGKRGGFVQGGTSTSRSKGNK